MKGLIILLIPALSASCAFAQVPAGLNPVEERLYHELKQYNYVESEYKGFDGVSESVLWKKADSFFENLPPKDLLLCFNDSSRVIKYYAFLKLLRLNDRVAYKTLEKMIGDSTPIWFWFDDTGGEERFNLLLAREYETFIKLKYLNGGIITLADGHFLGDTTYYFPKANAKTWKARYLQFYALMKSTSLKMPIRENIDPH